MRNHIFPTHRLVPYSRTDTGKWGNSHANKFHFRKERGYCPCRKGASYVTDERKEDQKAVDGQLMALIKKEDYLKGYLQMAFSLSNKQRPQKMVF